MHRIALFLLLGIFAFAFSGCASTQPEDPNRVSTIPWNRPERWEGNGPLGSMVPGSGGY